MEKVKARFLWAREGAGVLPYSHIGMCRLIGYGFGAVLVWKRVYTLPILVWNRVWFSRNLRSVWTYLSLQFLMSKKERKICEFKMDVISWCYKFFLSNGEDVYSRDYRGQTAFLYACWRNVRSVVELLARKRARIHDIDSNGQLRIHHATLGNRRDVSWPISTKSSPAHVEERDP